MGCRDRESDALGALSDIYNNLSEASMKFPGSLRRDIAL